jgi:uncharacterized protein involved in copper resistance
MPNRSWMVVVMLTAAATSLAGCVQPGRSGPTQAPLEAGSATADPAPSPARSTQTPAGPGGTASPSAHSPTASADRAACAPDAFLPLMKRKFDDPATGLVIERVEVKRCRNNYAHVFAITAADPSGRSEYENEQLFLRRVNGRWESVAEGTGISCEDPDPRPEMLPACRALGYR